MDFDLDLLLLYVLDTLVDIKYGWLVVFSEAVMEIVRDEARFSDSRISGENELEHLRAFLCSGPTPWFRTLLSFGWICCIVVCLHIFSRSWILSCGSSACLLDWWWLGWCVRGSWCWCSPCHCRHSLVVDFLDFRLELADDFGFHALDLGVGLAMHFLDRDVTAHLIVVFLLYWSRHN